MNASDMNERLLWDWIELVWKRTPDGEPLRARILEGNVDDLDRRMAPFLDALDRWLGHTTREGFITFAREFARKLYSLDREDLARRAGLGDDGFLDARGFTVIMGEAYYHRVLTHGPLAGVGLEQAYMTLVRHYEKRFKEPYPRLDIPIATGSNPDGWPSVRTAREREARVAGAARNLATELRSILARGVGARVSIPALPADDLVAVLRRTARALQEGTDT